MDKKSGRAKGHDVTSNRPIRISFRELERFLETTSLQSLLVTDSIERIPNVGFIVQADCNLPIIPSYKIEIRRIPPKTGTPSRHWVHGFVSASYLNRLPGRLLLPYEWAKQDFNDLSMMVPLFRSVDVFDRRFKPLQFKDFTPTNGAYFPDLFPNFWIALLWAYWEHEAVKWSARADDVVQVGLYSRMREDNLRRICKKIRLLK